MTSKPVKSILKNYYINKLLKYYIEFYYSLLKKKSNDELRKIIQNNKNLCNIHIKNNNEVEHNTKLLDIINERYDMRVHI